MKNRAIQESVAALRKRLNELAREEQKIRAALSALAAVDSGAEAVIREKGNGHELAMQAPQRVYTYGFTAKCARCGKEFQAARVVNKNSPKRKHQYCHNPCSSYLHVRELKAKGEQAMQKEKTKGTVLVKGDSLSGGVHHLKIDREIVLQLLDDHHQLALRGERLAVLLERGSLDPDDAYEKTLRQARIGNYLLRALERAELQGTMDWMTRMEAAFAARP